MKRCAIYTRKSTEEGLDQAFNSLEAQREACEAYIASQVGEGWKAIRTRFDDGGLSGGNMDRPALQALLDEIDAGRVDIVVVYKVDRLTRSLADFAKLVERFDAKGISFVSVTQAFNTSNSMGRLTLNVLLSFAQFEREVTAERIKDKITASRRKGMWTGGRAPLGYDAINKTLIVNETEAKAVRRLFDLFCETQCARTTLKCATDEGIRSKPRTGGGGGNLMSLGALYHILKNPLYAGLIRCGKDLCEGQHAPIVERKIWETVQSAIRNSALLRGGERRRNALAGKLFVEGVRLTPSHAVKDGQRYRYYVTRPLDVGQEASVQRWRLAADPLDAAIVSSIENWLAATGSQSGFLGAGLSASQVSTVRSFLNEKRRAEASVAISEKVKAWAERISRIDISEAKMTIALNLRLMMPENLRALVVENVTLETGISLNQRGQGMRLVLGETDVKRAPDLVALRLIARAHRWRENWFSNSDAELAEIAARDSAPVSDASKQIRLAFLAPDIIDALLSGRADVATAERLRRLPDLPADWAEQRRLLLNPSAQS